MSNQEWKINAPSAGAATVAESPLAKTVREIAPGVAETPGARKTMRLSEQRPPAVGWLVDLDGAQKGEDFRLVEGKVTIGAGNACEIQIHNDFASEAHASLRYGDGVYILTDLDSTNGTSVNGQPVSRVELEDGDRVRIGETNYVFKGLYLGTEGGAR